ncbi:MAG: hypothetical protein JWO36_2563 [Myxococcales bacterium]|nr:hypothetical protein [Myxococcales bacterium]
MPRSPGKIFRDGLTSTATTLVEALTIPQTNDDTAETLTHPFHTYPARLHPATAKVLVELVGEGAKANQPIVDPFCGSGTVLVEARAAGHRAIGIDLNPLAVLVARAKTWTVPPRRRTALKNTAHEIFGTVLAAGKAARRAGAAPAPMRKPTGFDPNARNRRLARWFAPHVRRELETIATEIENRRADDPQMADVLLASLSAILYKVSSRSSDTDGTWVERNVARGNAARLFLQRVELLVAGLEDLSRQHGPLPEVFELDTRRMGEVVPEGTAAGIVTSPPYAGTYDYAEHQRLRFDFFGLRHRDLDAGELGSRRAFEADPPEAYREWKKSLSESIDTISRALAPKRAAALVVGDSMVHGRALYAMDDLRDALTSDLVIEAWASQERPMMGTAERHAFGARPKAEHIIVLRRT